MSQKSNINQEMLTKTFFLEFMQEFKNNLNKKFDKVEKELEMFTQKLEVVAQRLTVVDEKLEVVDRKLEVVAQRLAVVDEKLEVVDEKLEVVVQRLEVVDRKLEVIVQRLEVIDQRLDKLEKRTAKLEEKSLDHDDNFQRIYDAITDLSIRIAKFEEKNAKEHEEIISSLHSHVDFIYKKIEGYDAEWLCMNVWIKRFEEKFTKLEKSLDGEGVLT